jgi:cation diffusion facilitator family transporter
MQESIKALVVGSHDVTLSAIAIVVFCLTIVGKLALWFYCRQFSEESESVAAYAQDHFNDCVSNTPAFILAFVASAKPALWWLDASAALCVSLYILHTWVSTARENVSILMGASPPPEVLRKLTYLALVHCEEQVLAVDTVRAITFGGAENLQVDVDIVLPEDMPLKEAHDIGESLQIKLEQLPDVARAYVHLDYEFHHAPEHKAL